MHPKNENVSPFLKVIGASPWRWRMRNVVKTRTVRKGEQGTPQRAPTSLKPSRAKLPAQADENDQRTLEGFRADQRWMVRVYGD
jgi:hypothetical protein